MAFLEDYIWTIIALVAVILIILLIAIVVLCCCCCRRCCKNQDKSNIDEELGNISKNGDISRTSPALTQGQDFNPQRQDFNPQRQDFKRSSSGYGWETKGSNENLETVSCKTESEINYEKTRLKNRQNGKTVQCYTCDKYFKAERDLRNHERDTQCFTRRFRKYQSVNFNENKRNEMAELCSKSSLDDPNIYDKCKQIVREVLSNMLMNRFNRDRFNSTSDREGSSKIGLKTRKATEFDFSVKILLTNTPELLWKPFKFVYENDRDIDTSKPGKREMNDKDVEDCDDPEDIPSGYVGVRIQRNDVARFKDSCLRGVFSPFALLKSFHTFLTNAARETNIDDVKIIVCKCANGPAAKLLIEHNDIKHKISVDITPKIEIPFSRVNGNHWPRNETKAFLAGDKIQSVLNGDVYLVPKGDKYWAISFANYENAVIDIFRNQSAEKKIIRCMKVKLEAWQPQSVALQKINSYMIKIAFLWLRENLPDGKLWKDDQVTERYYNFLHEIKFCFRNRQLKSYFLPEVDLLRNLADDSLKEMAVFLQKEIDNMSDGLVQLNSC